MTSFASIWNLVCSEGHKHFSPTPDRFVGMSCDRTVAKKGEKGTSKCRRKLNLLRK